MVANVSQIESVVTVEFVSVPDEALVENVKGIGMVRVDDLTFKGFSSDEQKTIEQLNDLGISVSTPDGYMGGRAWYGSKSNKRLYGKELVAAIRQDLKNAGIKATVRRERCGYSTSITVTVSADTSDFVSKEDFVKNYDSIHEQWFQVPPELGGGEIHRDFVLYDNNKYTYEQRTTIQKYNAAKRYDWAMEGDTLGLNSHYSNKMSEFATDEFDEKLRTVKQILNQYNYDESNSMVDYFNVGFYDDIVIKKNSKKIKKSA